MWIKVVLVDDEKPALDELDYILSDCSSCEVVQKFDSAPLALAYIKREEPDIVFLDIDMPEIDGLTFAREIRRLHLNTQVVFATAYDHHALAAFEMDAVDYILKPYDKDRVYKAIRKIKGLYGDSTEPHQGETMGKLPIWKGERILMVDVEEILFVHMEGGILTVFTVEETYELNETLASLEEKLPSELFFRTHRAFIVNLSKIREVSPYFNNTFVVKVAGRHEEIPVSRSQLKTFKKRLGI